MSDAVEQNLAASISIESTASAKPFAGILRGAFYGLLALAAFILVCLVLHRVVPKPVIPVVTPKLAYFLAHKDEFDAVFIGSSRVCHGIVPAEFDATLKAQGVQCKSFNLAVEQMFPPATFQVLDTVLKSKPARLKWVFLELTPIYTTDLEPTLRSISWHDGPATALVIEDLAKRNGLRRLPRQLGTIFANLKIFLLNVTNVGRVPTLVHAEPSQADEATKYAGYMPLQGTHFESEAKAQKYVTMLAAMYNTPAHREPLLPVNDKAFAKQLNAVKASGAEPFLLVPPFPQSGGDFLDPKTPHTLFAFNDKERYANFFDLKNRYDGGHLNDVGARLFSQLLAEQFAAAQSAKAK